jgi:tetratricopeptide (TPR) repeat protein
MTDNPPKTPKSTAPPAQPFSRTASEQAMRDLQRALASQNFANIDEANAFLQTLMGRKLDEPQLDAEPLSPKEEAQELAYAAMEARTAAMALKFARQAIEKDPDCVDALMILAAIEAESPMDTIEGMRKAVAAGERSLGPEFFEENKGHFWGLVETRPYMRALDELASLLRSEEDYPGAIKSYERMIELNPNDNQGVRDTLLGLYLGIGDLEGARRLLRKYERDSLATFAWGRVLERILSNDPPGAAVALKIARKTNKFVELYLTAKRKVPENLPDMFAPGSNEEAIICIDSLALAWSEHEDAVLWVLKQLLAGRFNHNFEFGRNRKKRRRR